MLFTSRYFTSCPIPVYVWYIITIVAIFAYGHFLRQTGRPDVLEEKVIDDPAFQGCDGWAITHTLLWGFIGFLYPGHHIQALITGLVWEGFEDALGRNRIMVGGSRMQLVGDTDEETKHIDNTSGAFWYGRYTTDTFFNLFGYIVGSWAGSRWLPPVKETQRPHI